MAETETASVFSDDKIQFQSNPTPEPTLPKISKPGSKGRASSKAESRKIAPSLPQISETKHLTLELKRGQSRQSRKAVAEPEYDFAMEIENKLKMVLENVNQGEEIADGSGQEEEDVEFEELINQNIELLKQKKQTHNIGRERANSKASQRSHKPKSKTVKYKKDNSIYQKRMKEYRNGSVENKYLQRKKESIAQKQEQAQRQQQERLKLSKNKEERVIAHTTKQMTSVPKSLTKSGPRRREEDRRHKQTLKSLPTEAKTDSLFDNIHNLLEHPHKIRSNNSSLRRYSGDAMQLLQEKINKLNQKLGNEEASQELKGTESMGAIAQKTVTEWKRLQYNSGSNFRCHLDSNFEKELDRVGNLQDRNNDYLVRLIDQQKKLVELSYLAKMSLPKAQSQTN